MSDDKKEAGQKPLEKARVEVEAEPNNRHNQRDREVAGRAARRVKEAVEKELSKPENKQAGSDKQLHEADQALNRERDQVPGKHVKSIRVKVSGEREDERGKIERVTREREVKPGD
ncbi:hypothetical protein KKF05_00240 [Patescibacteria group bacterium]|nr:hypothetical protein [Patescibacteria group bacterium]MBU1028834.1 hypothetical protein [Patescibacteria group bacterium]MBU1915873.1 hypothetical protein [Patescibacteria group bacterium]